MSSFEFSSEKAFFDEKFLQQKNNYEKCEDIIYDIGIEFIPFYEEGEEEDEIIFISLFNIEKKSDIYEIKCVCQKLKKHKFIFDIKDIYDGAGTNGKCIICYENYRNTIFLECRHSSCCQKCSGNLFPKHCPLCKNQIKDIICLDNDKNDNSIS